MNRPIDDAVKTVGSETARWTCDEASTVWYVCAISAHAILDREESYERTSSSGSELSLTAASGAEDTTPLSLGRCTRGEEWVDCDVNCVSSDEGSACIASQHMLGKDPYACIPLAYERRYWPLARASSAVAKASVGVERPSGEAKKAFVAEALASSAVVGG